MKKKKSTQVLPLDDLAVLSKLATLSEWKVLEKVIRTGVHNAKEAIVVLSNDNPTKLAIEKSRLNGIIAGQLLVIKKVETAATKMEQLALDSK